MTSLWVICEGEQLGLIIIIMGFGSIKKKTLFFERFPLQLHVQPTAHPPTHPLSPFGYLSTMPLLIISSINNNSLKNLV